MASILKLTPRHLHIYEFIVAFKQDHDGVSPSILEICEGCRIRSSSMVRHYFEALVVLGMISVNYSGRRSRMISVSGARWIPPVFDIQKTSPAPRADRARFLSASSISE